MFYNPLLYSIIFIGNEWQFPSACCRYCRFIQQLFQRNLKNQSSRRFLSAQKLCMGDAKTDAPVATENLENVCMESLRFVSRPKKDSGHSFHLALQNEHHTGRKLHNILAVPDRLRYDRIVCIPRFLRPCLQPCPSL